ncbi:HAD hydrolase family protein [Thomasclavelia ramosa]|uniref:HAD hydrolase family protein n=1 Tax=Thomasclavelia ramosa TaxID=1547 RepID=UPI001F33C877|nr:HAD hydrolase family protein [Thomasclavelia ramosa]
MIKQTSLYSLFLSKIEGEVYEKGCFLDVDGTLIDYEAKLPSSAAKAVDEERANGHKVYICTGCSKAEIAQRNLCDLDEMIGGNGAYVEDNDYVVMHQGLSKEEVNILLIGTMKDI